MSKIEVNNIYTIKNIECETLEKVVPVKKEERVRKWDNIKFFLIYLVVLGHILDMFITNGNTSSNIQAMRFYIYLFHMPLFLFISGIFSKKNIDNKRYLNIFYFLILFYIVKIIVFFSNVFQDNKYSFSMFSESGVPWYCFALFAFCMITILLKKVNKIFVFITSIVLGCIVGYDNSVSDYLVLSRIIVFYPFFFAGYCLDGDKVIKFLSNKMVKIISVIVVVGIALIVYININEINWLSPLLSGRNPYKLLKNKYYLGGLLRIVYYMIIFIMGAAIISIIPNSKKIKLFANFGTRTLQAYALHYPVVYFLFYGTLNPDIWMSKLMPFHHKILIFPVALIITIFFSLKIWQKPFDFLKKSYMKKIIVTTK